MNLSLFQFTGTGIQSIPGEMSVNKQLVQLVLCFAGKDPFSSTGIYELLRNEFPVAEIILCSTEGEINQADRKDQNPVLAAFEFPDTTIKNTKIEIRSCSGNTEAAGKLPGQADGNGPCYNLIINYGNLINESVMANSFIKDGGSKTGTGNLAGEGIHFHSAWVGLNGQPDESRESESVTRTYSSTGLEISASKELVELMKDYIKIESTKGSVITIRVEIPFNKAGSSEAPATGKLSAGNNFLLHKKILVAEDDEMNRLVASTILQHHGAEVIEAADGQEALDCLGKETPDLILMDIQMPVLSGYSANSTIRKTNTTIPVIALIANDIHDEKEKCLALGMNDIITKPFKEEELLKKIGYWLQKKKTITSPVPQQNGLPLYDLSSLQEISHGNTQFVHKMVELFCEKTPALVRQMQEAYDSRSLITMGILAQKIKPSLDGMKINSLRQAIRIIEINGKENEDSHELPRLLQMTKDVIAEVVYQLRTINKNQLN